jgi:pSer/pThr/pTyr-binding forkhead associated (FHA) protein
MSPAGAIAVGTVPATAQPMTAPLAAPRPLTLVAIAGPLTGARFEVRGTLEIGREASGISLAFDSTASRRHAAITPTPLGLTIQDLGSTNGTLVNGGRVTQRELRPGDTIQIGVSVFRVE